MFEVATGLKPTMAVEVTNTMNKDIGGAADIVDIVRERDLFARDVFAIR